MCASAYHTFSNFVSNSCKLKFRPIIIKRLPKPTFSWYVLQAKSIAFKNVSLLFHLYSLKMLQALQCVSFSCAVFPWEQLTQHHRHSLRVPAPSHGLGTQRWAAGTGCCSLQGWPDLMAGMWGSPQLHTTPGLSPAHLSNGLQDPQVLLAGPKLSGWSQWPREREAITCWYITGGEEEHVLPCCSIQGEKKTQTNSQRNFCL